MEKFNFVTIDEGQASLQAMTEEVCEMLNAVATQAAKEEALTDFEVEIVLTGDALVRQLNETYRGVADTTDVLSFPANELNKPLGQALEEGLQLEEACEPGSVYLGEIYISVAKATEQAEEYGNTLLEELSFLTAHGMLHLMGYDHETKEEEMVMRQKQRIILGREGA